MYSKRLKRVFDAVFALIGLIVLSPVLLTVAALVRRRLGRPVIFKQQRPGERERIFTLYKFRTMTDECGEDGELLPDGQRLTEFGAFLRGSSLDELPELLNILKADMSFVGPRPLLIRYLPYYDEFQRRRHSVKPGLTGLAQINGRNASSWGDRLNYDIKYAENVTFAKDLMIVASTIGKVLRREGVSAENHATMESFIDYVKRERQDGT